MSLLLVWFTYISTLVPPAGQYLLVQQAENNDVRTVG